MTVWHLVFYLLTCTLPIHYFKEYFDFAKSSDQSGELGIIGINFFMAFVLALGILVNSILFSTTFSMSIMKKILIVVGSCIIFPIILIVLGFTTDKTWGVVTFYLYYFLIIILNLYMLYRFNTRIDLRENLPRGV